MINQLKIGFVGGGNMAQSLISGLLASGFLKENLWVNDHNEHKKNHIAKEFGIQIEESNIELAKKVDVLVLAVKPKDVPVLLKELKETLIKTKPLIVSLATGITTAQFKKWLQSDFAIVRAMPNTPALLRVSATGLYANSQVTEEQKNLAESLLRSVGITVWVNHEHELDIIAALSGSGPAYFFLVMECLQDASHALGLSNKVANLLILQTALGAAKMALESEIDLIELRKQVTSPGGITEKALKVLEDGNIRSLFKNAIKAAKEGSLTISEQLSQKEGL